MKSLLATILLAVSVVWCKEHPSIEKPDFCIDFSLPTSIKNESVSKLYEHYNHYLMQNNITDNDITVLDVLAHALNATGNKTATAEVTDQRIGCMEYFKFTLTEIAFQNLIDPDMFPENKTLEELMDMIITNTTANVLRNLRMVHANLVTKTLNGSHTIHELMKGGHFSHHSRFIDIMRYILNASSLDATAEELHFPKSLLLASMTEMADYLFTNVSAFQMHLSLKMSIRLLHSAKHWLTKLRAFLNEKRMELQNKTVDNLFMENGLNKTNTTILTMLKQISDVQGINMTFLQFFGSRRVHLDIFDFNVQMLGKITFTSTDVMSNYTLHKLFNFAFMNYPLIKQHNQNMKLAKQRREMILIRYDATFDDLMKSPFNLTDVYSLSDIELENYVIRWFFWKYAWDRNLTLTQLENMSNITEGSLANATVFNFVDLLVKIANANVLRHIKEHGSLSGIITDLTDLYLCNLRMKIMKERQPITLNLKMLAMLPISYHISQEGLNPKLIYSISFYDFIDIYLNKTLKISFIDLLRAYGLYRYRVKLEVQFKKFTFKDFNMFIRFSYDNTFSWTLRHFLLIISDKIINDENECQWKPPPCKNMDHGVKCLNHPYGFTCKCPADKNLNSYDRCADINECRLESTPACRNYSHCVNSVGSYECKCNIGFEDKDGNCTDINECERDDRICYRGVNVQCNNTIGSFHCNCLPGYRFHWRYGCIDIDECETSNPCDHIPNSRCKNSPGSYSCKCKIGYKSENNNCTDINECSLGTDRCHKHATCNNNDGSYKCTCKDGYIGNGYDCKGERLYEYCPTGMSRTRNGRVKTDLKFFFNQKMHNKLYISEDGYISIGKRYTRYSPTDLTRLDKDVIAPFWASTSVFDGSVTYCELVQDDDRAVPLLNKLNKFVRNATMEKDFEAAYGIIVTWKNMVPVYWFRFFQYNDESNTFQAAIVSNGGTTVVIYLYEEDGMTWYRVGRDAAVGYSYKKNKGGEQVPGSFTPDIYNIDKQIFTDPAGNDCKGCWIRVFKDTTQEPPSSEDKCLSWIREESKKDQDWIENLADCTCTYDAVSYDLRFMRWPGGDSRDSKCYILRRNRKTRSCCYDFDSGALITAPDSRAGRAFRYGPNEVNKFQSEEENPWTWCCLESSTYCNDFYQLRPSGGCEEEDDDDEECTCGFSHGFRRRRRRRRRRFFGVRRGASFGDPHVMTLDGLKYTFNGLGDYVMLQTKDKEDRNVIHTRTRQIKNGTGSLLKATIYYGFAMQSSQNTTVQVMYNSNMTGNLAITTVNQTMHCQNVNFDDLDKHPIAGFQLYNSSKTLVILFDSGLVVEITPGKELLQFALSVPAESFENKTMGLLGTLNANMNDDLMYRDGALMSSNSTDKEIFEYGKNWTVQADERLFVNSNCQKENINASSFIPLFYEDIKNNITDQMNRACNNNKQCILDYFVTGDSSFANATLKYEEENEKIKKIFANRPPSIATSPKSVDITVGKTVTINITVTDPNSDPIASLVAVGLPSGARFDNSTTTHGILTWTVPANLTIVNIQFTAIDSQGAASMYDLMIRYCDCKNSGSCVFDTIPNPRANSSLQLVGCNCSEQYTGDQCETEVNPCEDDPCYTNVTCTVDFNNNPSGVKCGQCPKGMEGNGKVCNDFDECLNSSRNNCTESEKCVNEIGGFRCECKPGYERNDDNKCVDLKECTKPFFVSKCKDNTDCTNTPGSYNCTCKKGYKGDPLVGCTDIDECFGDDKTCFATYCKNTPGSVNCTCSSGFKIERFEGKKLRCKDIDECKFSIDNNCEQVCYNNMGSFICGCKPGFILKADKKSCQVKAGHTCDNRNGGCQQLCTNSTGNVTCHCNRGYTLNSDGKTCKDVNECSTNKGGCDQKCNNIPGSYNCSCWKGYDINNDKRTCTDINECSPNNGRGNCDQRCRNHKGGWSCTCRRGFNLNSSDNKTCEDINECKDADSNDCGQYRVCTNKPGGYRCSCKDKRTFSDGKSKCRRSKRFMMSVRMIMEWHSDYDDEYSEKSITLRATVVIKLGKFFRKFRRFTKTFLGCAVIGRFRKGSVLANVSVNFDSDSNVTVNEVNGAVKGASDLGGVLVDPTYSNVTDVNECSDPSLNNCHENAVCTNEVGSFSCQCKDGYKGDGFSCEAEPKEKSSSNDKVKIILLCTLIPLGVIIIIIIIWCCCRRRNKGNLHMDDDLDGHHAVHMRKTQKGGEVYYGNENGRRQSDDSMTGHYDIAGQSHAASDGREPQTTSGTYDVAQGQYYDNPAVVTEGNQKEASL